MEVNFVHGKRVRKVKITEKWQVESVAALLAKVYRCDTMRVRRISTGEVIENKEKVGNVFRNGDTLEVRRQSSLVVTTTCSNYFAIFELWLKQKGLEGKDIVLICLDGAAVQKAERIQAVKETRLKTVKTKADIWSARLEVMIEMTERFWEAEIVHSDADAFWISDPFPFLFQSSDIVFSIDHGLGRGTKPFALCCGFYALRNASSSRVHSFLKQWLHETIRLQDDQLAINALYDSTLISTLPYDAFQRCNRKYPVPLTSLIVWHPWLEAPLTEKFFVWNTILNDIQYNHGRLLHAFYRQRAETSLTLDARELYRLLSSLNNSNENE